MKKILLLLIFFNLIVINIFPMSQTTSPIGAPNTAFNNVDNNFTVGQTISGTVTANNFVGNVSANTILVNELYVSGTGNITGNLNITNDLTVNGTLLSAIGSSGRFADVNAVSAFTLNDVNINSAGALSNVAYLDISNTFNDFLDTPTLNTNVLQSSTTNNVYVNNALRLNTNPSTPNNDEGTIYWNNNDHTLNLQTDISSVILQVGQEQLCRVRNNSGVTINNGDVVYITGALGNRPTIAKALASSANMADAFGVATEQILNNHDSYVTLTGLVRDLNTNAFNEGDTLYLDAVTAGAVTANSPQLPNYAIKIGTVVYSHNNNGIINVHAGIKPTNTVNFNNFGVNNTATINNAIINGIDVDNAYVAQQAPTGFPNRTDTTLSWSDVSRNLTITGTNFKIYYDGKEFTKNTESIAIPNVSGYYFVYYNSSGTLVTMNAFPGFPNTLISSIYYNSTTGKGLYSDERHGANRNIAWHSWAHNTIGARYSSGLTGTFANTTLNITSGSFYDEDILFSIPTVTTCNVLFKNGSDTYQWVAATSSYYLTSAGTLLYNNGTATANVGSNQYVAYWVFAVNDPINPIVSLMGQRVDTTLANAQANNLYSSLSLGTLPYAEMKLLYRVILRNVGGTPTYIETQDLRTVSTLPSGTAVSTDHNNLTGLQGGTTGAYYHSNQSINTTDAVLFATVNVSSGITLNTTTADIYSVPWTNYSSISTVSGWSATPTKYIYYKKIGKTVFVNFEIIGTSNDVTHTFTLPYPVSSNNPPLLVGIGRGVEGSTDVGNSYYIQSGVSPSLVENFKGLGFGNYSNSGSLTIVGSIVYEATQ